MSASGQTTIAVVGAGFAGIATACNLMRIAAASRAAIKVILIGEPQSYGGGVAYCVEDDNLLLNVPVGNMSLHPDRPDDFLEFCNEIDGAWVSGSFVSRRLYGQYLESCLAACLATARSGSLLMEEIRQQVEEVVPLARGFRLELADGEHVNADRVVLALGHLPSLPLPHVFTHGETPWPTAQLIDAWDACALHRLSPDQPVLVVGTGHTAVDTVFRLVSMAPERKVFMLSRHGRLPAGHRKADEFVRLPKLREAVEASVRATLRSQPTVRALLARLRQLAEAHAAEGGDWRDVINSLRAITPEIWDSLTARERARFGRHLISFWDPVRHRLAPVAARRLARLLESGRAEVIAGRMQRVEPVAGATKWSVTFLPRGTAEPGQVEVGGVINCNGSNFDVTKTDSALIKNLLKAGLRSPDSQRLGLNIDAQYRCCKLEHLYYVGPMLKARYWESTAVPELRRHAATLAAQLLDGSADRPGEKTEAINSTQQNALTNEG